MGRFKNDRRGSGPWQFSDVRLSKEESCHSTVNGVSLVPWSLKSRVHHHQRPQKSCVDSGCGLKTTPTWDFGMF